MPASTPQPETTPSFAATDALELDPFHGAVVDEVCATDAGRADAGELIWLRPATAHEFCYPGGPCWTWPAWVIVRALGRGVRLREPLPADWLEAAS